MAHPTGERNRVEPGPRGCGTAVLVALCAALALLIGGAVWLQHSLDLTPPDGGPFARSDATRTADKAATQRSSARLQGLTAALPWAVPLGTSVVDSCETHDQNPFIGRSDWSPFRCTRTSVLYVAFDGDIRARLRQLDAALAEKSWKTQNPLADMARYLEQTGEDTPSPSSSEEGSTASPTPRPLCLSATYAPASQETALPPPGTGVRLQAAVAEHACPPFVSIGRFEPGDPPRKSTDDGTVYLAWHPLSTTAVSTKAYTTHRYVASFALSDTYAVQSSPTTSPSPTPTRYYPPVLLGQPQVPLSTPHRG